jgi:hypothetical protein
MAIDSTAHNDDTIIGKLARARGEKAHRKRQPSKGERGTAMWYQRLAQYYLDRRRQHDGFWAKVDQNYWQRGISDKARSMFEELDEVRPGRIYSYVHTVEGMVFNRSPKMFLKGFTPRVDREQIPVFEKALNHEWWQDRRLVRETKLAVRDCIKYGFGVTLTRYEKDPDVPIRVDEVAEAAREADEIASVVYDAMDDEYSDMEARRPAKPAATNFEMDSRVVKGRVVTTHIPIHQFMCDPDASCLEDCRWVGRMILADYWAVKEDPALKNTSSIGAASRKDIQDWLDITEDTHNPYDQVILYEIFERQPDGSWEMTVTSPQSEKILRREKSPYWIGQPYSMLRWSEDGRDIFAQSDLLNLWTIYLSEVLLGTKVTQAYAREMLDTTFVDDRVGDFELAGAIDPEVGKIVKIKNPGQGRIQDVFFKAPKDAKSPEAMNLLAMYERAFQAASGLGPNQMGQALKSETSASEANEIAGFARARSGHKGGATEDFVADIATKRLGLMAQFYTRAQIKRLVGNELGSAWPVDWVEGDVSGGLSVIVHPGSMAPENDAVRVQQIVGLLQVLGTNPVFASAVNMPELLNRLLRGLGFGPGDNILMTEDGQAMSQSIASMAAMQSGAFQGGMGGGQASPSNQPNVPTTSGEATQQAL